MYVTQALHRLVQQEPDRPLTMYQGRVRTVAESADRVARLAGALRSAGVGPGDRVGMLSLNSDCYHEFMLGVPWAGAVVNPVNIRWSPAEVAYSLADCDTRVLLVDDAFAPAIPALREQAPCLQTVIFCGEGSQPGGTLHYEQLLAENLPAQDAHRRGGDLYGVFYTGGTTGNPKGVMLSHDNLLVSAMGTMATAHLQSRGGSLLHAAPMFHLADVAMWMTGMLAGCTHVIVPMFAPAAVAAAISEHKVTDVLLVPTMIQMLVDAPETADADLTSVQRIIYGASPISAALLDRARKRLESAAFTQAYGMTELAPVATLLSPADHEDPGLAQAAGRAAAHAEVARRRPRRRRAAPRPGRRGRRPRRQRDAGLLEQARGDGGRAARRLDAHRRRRLPRRPRLPVHRRPAQGHDHHRRGERVLRRGRERPGQHPAVAACAVIGMPDARWGERVHAVVVPQPGQRRYRRGIAGVLPRAHRRLQAAPQRRLRRRAAHVRRRQDPQARTAQQVLGRHRPQRQLSGSALRSPDDFFQLKGQMPPCRSGVRSAPAAVRQPRCAVTGRR